MKYWSLLPLFACAQAVPNVIFFLADDLGWNDLKIHGSDQIPSPTVDEICSSGITLNRFYAQSVCSPTRASLLSGRHVIHSGVYSPFKQGSSYRLNETYKILPGYLKDYGYDTHMVGKWHLGQNTEKVIPTGRGFDSYLGYYCGAEDYFQHNIYGGYDFFDQAEPAWQYEGQYSTSVFTDRAIDIIDSYAGGGRNPFFMYFAFQNVHWPLQVPSYYEKNFTHIRDTERRTIAAMVTIMDEGIRNVTDALKRNNLFDNTMIIFQSDNGGPTNHTEGTQSNNYPLRGGKNTLWEGGTRVSSCISGPLVSQHAGKIWEGYMHVTDWVPTIVEMIGGQPPQLETGDGMSVWSALKEFDTSPRNWILTEAHSDNTTEHGNALIYDGMKILIIGETNPTTERGWYPPPQQNVEKTPYTVKCSRPPKNMTDYYNQCTSSYCLFNVTADPCEYHDLSEEYPEILKSMIEKLHVYREIAVPPTKPVGCTPFVNKTTGAWQTCG
eukprot:TRINITY_DN3105_c1_g1_i1.p1 TRINITY_DN3105_c1_g1~~TRINITY_DN3105_c1_g1_i1.p1  ORF type:complete len:494 (+),score=74.41 TRINITY_DN3105_c1_g1_i1:97-1578(+)